MSIVTSYVDHVEATVEAARVAGVPVAEVVTVDGIPVTDEDVRRVALYREAEAELAAALADVKATGIL